jgi:hypothetical protein
VLADAGQELVEVGAGEPPVEGPGLGVVAVLEGEDLLGEVRARRSGPLPGAAMRRPGVAGDVYGILGVAVGGFLMVARALAVWTASLSASMS